VTTPPPAGAARIACIIGPSSRWSVFWDKKYRVWRAAEDDPDSELYTESPDADVVIQYISQHS